MQNYNRITTRVETWNVRHVTAKGEVTKRPIGKIVARDGLGRFDGATNYRQTSRVGQVRKSRR